MFIMKFVFELIFNDYYLLVIMMFFFICYFFIMLNGWVLEIIDFYVLIRNKLMLIL